MENYNLTEPRYEAMNYRRCGRSGILLPEISLGFWHNFGGAADPEVCRAIVETAFDGGVTCFDLANNYGPPYGSAEEMFGRIFARSLRAHRDEILVTTKAGHDMWPGPYGEWGSRKSLFASIDQSLRRMGLDYVDIFYSHRPALYAGISKYPPAMAARAYAYLREAHVPCLVYQGRYNLLDRSQEEEILPQAAAEGVGYVAFSPLAQGLLTDRYLGGIPADSRMRHSIFLDESVLTPELLARLRAWNEEAAAEGLTLAQYALRWILRRPEVSSVIVGASSVAQLKDNLKAVRAR